MRQGGRITWGELHICGEERMPRDRINERSGQQVKVLPKKQMGDGEEWEAEDRKKKKNAHKKQGAHGRMGWEQGTTKNERGAQQAQIQ